MQPRQIYSVKKYIINNEVFKHKKQQIKPSKYIYSSFLWVNLIWWIYQQLERLSDVMPDVTPLPCKKWKRLTRLLPIIFRQFWTDFLASKIGRQWRIDPEHLLPQLSSCSPLSVCQLPSSYGSQTLLLLLLVLLLLLLCHNHALIWFILSPRGCLMNRDVCSAALYM